MSDRIDPSFWVHHLPTIPVGGKRRYPHDCGEGRTLVVFHNEPESSCYCHRCGSVGYHMQHLSVADALALQEKSKAAENAARTSLELPQVDSRDPGQWPAVLRNWFYKMGLGPAHISALGLYHNKDMDRIVLPILDEDRKVVYWTARSASRTPKWLGPDVPKHGLVARYGTGKGDAVVLTEDPLSAYKVGLVCEAWCLFGTKLKDAVALQLLNDPRRVVTWLDDDQGRRNGSNPGQDAAQKMRSRLRALGKDVANVTSDKDPKYLTRQRIRELLWTGTK